MQYKLLIMLILYKEDNDLVSYNTDNTLAYIEHKLPVIFNRKNLSFSFRKGIIVHRKITNSMVTEGMLFIFKIRPTF